ncbi:MAG: terpene cyclase/mutase family protein [Verrucomicrobiae bacterium]|nr:terpene cyclase/mutase family protein [Verrucomicrobiae bacterium]
MNRTDQHRDFPYRTLASRRGFLAGAGMGMLGLTGLPQLLAQEGEDSGGGPAFASTTKTAAELITPETESAIEKGLAYLAKAQIKTGPNRGSFGNSGADGSVAISGLAGLAFLCGGNVPGRGKYGKEVENCIDFIVRNTHTSGYIARTSNGYGNMYGHGFATLFLSQAYGMTRKKSLEEKLRAAVKLILYAQNKDGGWRYSPSPTDADLSITVCQIMALRGARDAGINVPDKVRDNAIDYVKKSHDPTGGFRYTLSGGHSTFALTAAGVVSLYSAGIYDGKEIKTGLDYIKKNKASAGGHFFYGHYYAVQAMWHAGGEEWNQWYPEIRQSLLAMRQAGGGWSASQGNAYATAMALIILQMPKDLVPVYAR